MTLEKFGWIKTRKSEPKILSCKEIYVVPKFLGRNVHLSFDITKNYFLKQWYINKYLENFTLRNIFNFKSFYLNPFLVGIFRKIYFKINKSIEFNLTKKDILILGPYAHNHFHILNDFILRVFLLDYNETKKIYIPSYCKKYINALKLDKYLKFKFIYLENNKNYRFKNARYITHLETRINNKSYKNCINKLKKIVKIKKSKQKYNILISRENNKRKILNENILYKKLKKENFIKLNFEKLNFAKQVFYSFNSRFIIGYHGSGIINPILFHNPKTILLEILHKNYNHKMYEKMSKTVGLKYKSFICDGNKNNFDCFCNIEEIMKYLNFKLN